MGCLDDDNQETLLLLAWKEVYVEMIESGTLKMQDWKKQDWT